MQGRQTDWGIQLDAARATAMRRSGAWHVLTEFFQPHAAAHPERMSASVSTPAMHCVAMP